MNKLLCPECNTHIDEHKPGLCLRRWLAEAVMCWTVDDQGSLRDPNGPFLLFRGSGYQQANINTWLPDQRIEDAWKIIDSYILCINVSQFNDVKDPNKSCVVSIYSDVTDSIIDVNASAFTVPLAICRAAIKTIA